MSIYNRICALPNSDKARLFTFYERYLGSVEVREVLGECHFQASEYCSSMNKLTDYSKELRESLEKIKFFYPDNDPIRISIQKFFEKAGTNEEYWQKDVLDQFFQRELTHLISILQHKQNYLKNLIPQVERYHNFSYPDIASELNSIFSKLSEDLEFIVIQLEQTRFAGRYIENFDGLFENELLKLINIYSVLLLEMASLFQKLHQRKYGTQIYDFIEKLLQSSLVIRHPTVKNSRACTQKMSLYKFVLKTNSNLKFQADFFAPVLLKNVKDKIKCEVLLVNESVANGLIERPDSWTDNCPPETCASLSNAKVDFKEDAEKGLYSAKFERLNASNVTRCERRITDIVTDSKVVFVFHCSFQYQFRDIKVRGFSQPVVFVVHVVQESSAHGTMSWHNALTKYSHSRRDAPSEVPYAEVAKILSDRFFYTTGRGLTLENLKNIRREPFVDHAGMVTAKAFLKDVLQEFARNHQKEGDIKETKEKKAPSFWDWFYECNKLTISSFKENWKRGLVEGFIPKKMAERLLMNEPLGSFIIRFSQSMLGVVSFDNNYGLAPFFSSCEFKGKTLDRCILSHQSLTFLYPNRRVEDLFTSSPTLVSTSQHPGYVKVLPTYIIQRIDNGCSPTSQHGTYSNISQSPSPSFPSPAHPFSSPGSSSVFSFGGSAFSHPTPTHPNTTYQQFIQTPLQPSITQAALQQNPMMPAVPTTMQNSMPQNQNQNPNFIHRPNVGVQSPQIVSSPQQPMFPQSPSQYQNTQIPSHAQSVHSHNSFGQQIQNQPFLSNNAIFPENDSMDFENNVTNGTFVIPPFDTSFSRHFHQSPNNYSPPTYPSPNYSSPSNQPRSYQSPNYN